jgi:hypothetical protein
MLEVTSAAETTSFLVIVPLLREVVLRGELPVYSYESIFSESLLSSVWWPMGSLVSGFMPLLRVLRKF